MYRTIVVSSALLFTLALATGCEKQDASQNPQTAQNPYQQGQYPQGQYPQGQPPPGGYQQPPPGGYQQPPPGGYQQPPPGGYQQPAPGGYQQPYPQQPGQPAPQQPAPGGTAAPAPGGFPFPIPGMPAPGGAPAPQQGGTASGGLASRIDPNFAAAATGPLMLFAQQQAPGMQREGNVAAAQFQEGQSMEEPVSLQPGKCYTVLAVGAGVAEVDIALQLTTPMPGMNPALAQDSGAGHQAALGGGGNCYKWPWPMAGQAKYVIKATRGSGIVAGQLYVK